jgi:type IV pilus assembly protein PilP
MAGKMNKIMSLLILSFIMVTMGCANKDQKAAKQASEKPKAAAPAAPVQQKEEPKVEKEVYIYDAKNRRDPFMSLVAVAKEKPLRIKKANPVENYDVDEIKLSAIAWNSRQYYALITLPDGKSYTLTKGMTLGIYGGKVADIKKDSVLIREQVKDYRGQTKTKDTILRLRKEEGE